MFHPRNNIIKSIRRYSKTVQKQKLLNLEREYLKKLLEIGKELESTVTADVEIEVEVKHWNKKISKLFDKIFDDIKALPENNKKIEN